MSISKNKLSKHSKQAQNLALVEVIDANGQPLLAMSYATVLRHRLPYKLVISAVFAGKKILLHRDGATGKAGDPVFGLFASPVCHGESVEDASIRAFKDIVGCEQEGLTVCDGGIPFFSSNTRAYLVKSRLPLWVHVDSFVLEHNLLALDRDELLGLCADSADMFAPHVHWAAEHADLFKI